MLKILIACSGLGHVQRGFEIATAELAQSLEGSVDVVLARGGGSWFRGAGIRLPCVQRFGELTKLAHIAGDRAYLVEQRSFAPFVYGLARMRGVDVVHLHDPGLMNGVWHARRVLGGSFAILFTNGGWLSPDHLHRPDLVQCVTPVDAARLREAGFADWKVASVPHGVDLPTSPPREFHDGPPTTLIGVGALNDSSKGFATAIRAVANVDGASLRLIGQRDEETPMIEQLGQRLLGPRFSSATVPRNAVPSELAAADAFVLPTHSEGFCLAVLEAMAAGLPCVVADIPVLRWLVGDAGVLVAPDQPELWAGALRSLTAQRRRELSLAGVRRATQFRWHNLIADHVKMYHQAVAARRRATDASQPPQSS